jgi:tRNA dimethylallyltransferase
MKRRIVCIAGPTASGKTETALELAKHIKAEVISCDAMQIYKGMDMITSKPDAGQSKRLIHHLIDVVSPQEEYNVARFRKEAMSAIQEIFCRKKAPLLVGGTGLYLSILIDGIFTLPALDENIRKKLYALKERRGNEYLYEKLKKVDPVAAAKIHPHDAKRIVRALEVFESTGKPISTLQKQRKGLCDEYDVRMYVLTMKRDELYKRIDERVEKMFKQGLIEEVKKLLSLHLSPTASCAIGIKELKGYFDGTYTLAEAKRLMQQNTRNYAKRQLTWFRKDKRYIWIERGQREKPVETAQRIAVFLRKRK